MPGIITEGYGPQNLIISAGYGFWRRIIEVIERVVRSAIRFIPIGKERFRSKISVYGDLSSPYLITKPVTGDFLISTKTSLPTRGFPFLRIKGKIPVTGDLTFREAMSLLLLGDLISKYKITRSVLGNLVIKIQKKIKIKGKKDFRKIIFELLEEEE